MLSFFPKALPMRIGNNPSSEARDHVIEPEQQSGVDNHPPQSPRDIMSSGRCYIFNRGIKAQKIKGFPVPRVPSLDSSSALSAAKSEGPGGSGAGTPQSPRHTREVIKTRHYLNSPFKIQKKKSSPDLPLLFTSTVMSRRVRMGTPAGCLPPPHRRSSPAAPPCVCWGAEC